MSGSFHFDEPGHFAVGTVGPRGQRVFYLQAGSGSEVVAFKIEKQQVAALAEYVDQLLDDVAATADADTAPADQLREPIVPEWVVGALGVAYDEANDHIVLVAEELIGEDDDAQDDAATARFALSRAQARAYVQAARALVEAGRDPCPYCARPIDPGSDWCPCHN